jgi:hypothetical protein
MKRIVLILLWLTLAASAKAQEQKLTTWDRNVVQTDSPNPVFQSGRVNRFFHYIGRHSVQTFTDLGRDREWLLAFSIDTLAQTADTWTTCRGFSHGFREANPLFGHTNSCGQLVLGTGLLHITKWVSNHATTHEFVQGCWYEKYQGTGRQQSFWSGFGSPSSCKHVMWLGDVTTPFHIVNSINSVNAVR